MDRHGCMDATMHAAGRVPSYGCYTSGITLEKVDLVLRRARLISF
eukprot:COSAG02_NODE_21882_length_771_cov_1.587798_1_plen_44_part_10